MEESTFKFSNVGVEFALKQVVGIIRATSERYKKVSAMYAAGFPEKVAEYDAKQAAVEEILESVCNVFEVSEDFGK